jgi:hypothetical protein
VRGCAHHGRRRREAAGFRRGAAAAKQAVSVLQVRRCSVGSTATRGEVRESAWRRDPHGGLGLLRSGSMPANRGGETQREVAAAALAGAAWCRRRQKLRAAAAQDGAQARLRVRGLYRRAPLAALGAHAEKAAAGAALLSAPDGLGGPGRPGRRGRKRVGSGLGPAQSGRIGFFFFEFISSAKTIPENI